MAEQETPGIKKLPGIIFLGTPEFAVATLAALVDAGFPVLAVVTAPDKPAGRGLKLQESAVKKFALANNLPVLQPLKLKDPEFIEQLKSFNADLQVVVAFRMLPEKVWNMPPLGTLNLHASLLPQYRGAAPINWAIINGEKETGITSFRLKHEIDTGEILLQEKLAVGPNETAGELHDRMMVAGASMMVRTIRGIMDNSLQPIPQDSLVQPGMELKHAPKISTETCKIDWRKTAEEVHNQIRGLSPYPGAFTIFRDKMLKIFRSEIVQGESNGEPGQYSTDGKTFLQFACGSGSIRILELQMEGKKRMNAGDFLRGYRS